MKISKPDDGGGFVSQQTTAFVTAVQGTEVFQRFAAALHTLECDADVQRLLDDVQGQARVQGHPVVREFVDAQQALVTFLQETNSVISESLGMDFGQTAGRAGGAC